MGRLIDAEKVTEVDCSGLDGIVKPQHYEIVASFFFEKFINCQPTAFDVEKVIKEIHNFKCQKCRNILGIAGADEYCERQHCQVYQICEIVRKGGVNE